VDSLCFVQLLPPPPLMWYPRGAGLCLVSLTCTSSIITNSPVSYSSTSYQQIISANLLATRLAILPPTLQLHYNYNVDDESAAKESMINQDSSMAQRVLRKARPDVVFFFAPEGEPCALCDDMDCTAIPHDMEKGYLGSAFLGFDRCAN
jgi:hypothetical protein